MNPTLLLTFLIIGVGARTLGPIFYDSPEVFAVRQQMPKDKLDNFDNFVGFMKKYEKQYRNSAELRQRFQVFLENLEHLPKSQENEDGTAKHGVTQFFDFTLNEFKQKFLGAKLVHKKRSTKHDLNEIQLQKYQQMDVPEEVDWREKGAVTPIKNQGQCGSCYTFGAVGATEGQWFKKTGKLIAFSEEELLDCSDDGQCGGGDPLHVYDSIAEIGGLQTSESYPYIAGTEGTGDCNSDNKKFVAYVNGSIALPISDEELLKKVLASEGPVEINIDASPLFDYESGIIKPKDQEPGLHPEFINHAVLLVGYGVENGTQFWNIKNSWGTTFGEKGYFRVARGVDSLYLVDSNPSLPLIF